MTKEVGGGYISNRMGVSDMKKFSVILLTLLLLFTAISCRQVVFLPMPLPDGNEDVNPDVPPVSEEDIAAGETVTRITDLFGRIEGIIEAKDETAVSGSTIGPQTADIVFNAGETLTLIDQRLTGGWEYKITFEDDFSIKSEVYENNNGHSIYNGTMILTFDDGSHMETVATTENPFGVSYLVGPKIKLEFRNLDLNTLSGPIPQDMIFIDGKDIYVVAAEKGEDFVNAAMNAIIGRSYPVFGFLMQACSYKNASDTFIEFEKGEYKEGQHCITEFNIDVEGTGYSVSWDYPNVGLAWIDILSDDGKLSFSYTYECVDGYPIFESCTYNGISLSEEKLSAMYDKLYPDAALDFKGVLDKMANPNMQFLFNLVR